MLYMVTLTINIPQMLAYIPYMDPIVGNKLFKATNMYTSLITFVLVFGAKNP